MKLVKETASELTLNNSATVRGYLIFLSIWVIGWLAVPVGAYLTSGKDTIRCDRIEPTIVNCEVSQTRPLNLFANPTYTVAGVQEAIVNERVETDDDGHRNTYYQVSLVGGDGMPHPVTSWGIGYWINPIADEINALLPSGVPSWDVERNVGIPWFIVLGGLIVSLLPISLVISLLSIFLKRQTVILDKTTQRCTSTRETLWGKPESTQHYPFNRLDIKLVEYEDDYGTTRYNVKLLAGSTLIFCQENYEKNALEKLQAFYTKLCNFLGVPAASGPAPESKETTFNPQTNALESPTTANSRIQATPSSEAPRLFHKGTRATFSTRRLTTMPDTVDPSIQTAAQTLEGSTFQFVGDLQVDVLPESEIYSFAMPRQATYAVIISGIKNGVDFYTTFADGTSLTTTNMDVATRQMKSKKIYRYSYPDIDVANLLRKHQNHLTELMQTHGKPNPVRADLKAIAIAIDEYLVREASARPMLFGIQL